MIFDFSKIQGASLPFISIVLNIGIIAYAVFRLPRNRETQVFIFFVISLILWQFDSMFTRLSATAEIAHFWDRLFFIGPVSFAPICLHFVSEYTNNRFFKSNTGLALLYIPCVFFNGIYMAETTPTVFVKDDFWGWIIQTRPGTFDGPERIWISLLVILSVILLIRYSIKVRNNREIKLQALLIAIGITIPAIQGIITQVIFPLFHIEREIPLASATLTIFSIATIIAFTRFQLFSVSEFMSVDSLLMNLNDIVIIVNEKLRTIYLNNYTKKFLNIAPQQEKDWDIRSLFPTNKEYNNFRKNVIDKTLNSKIVSNYETQFVQGNNSIDILITTELITNNKTKQGVMIIARDISAIRNAEKEREKTTANLIRRNKDLEQFNFIVSHNLRAPLANIIGYSNALSATTTPEENEELTKGLKDSAYQLDAVIRDLNNILALRRDGEKEAENIDLGLLTQDVLSSLELDKNAEFSVRPHFAEAPSIKANKAYLYSIFQNLISNAYKYSSPRRKPLLEITSTLEPSQIKIVFKDNGIGINLKKTDMQIFGMYQRFHPHVEGKGLGLFIVKSQIEALGGEIEVHSKVGVGTEFVLTFPR